MNPLGEEKWKSKKKSVCEGGGGKESEKKEQWDFQLLSYKLTASVGLLIDEYVGNYAVWLWSKIAVGIFNLSFMYTNC